ncbi:sulfonate ABC transporter substrate-binding protein [Cryobacterium roopkundense]|uniref:NitT/TauT family transport system substrate-binding protein n=1 Tax=Cryobacterium roopkundense TaxID=1001240 RepID=A0A099JRT2_9MICO|nr:ABC transporter substrate-binding protein [Cryobacterium roopkundense]KGJ80093.1 sulfonate ABC transporter substrate-binding protein [Cryobacterium roopkundense]MBB5641623.1 NitT/TauT family transport system substrate-binding protein [Cryobacterium roopkundense]
MRAPLSAVGVALAATLLLSGCSGAASAGGATGPADELRLGYFDNLTQAPALVGIQQGIFADALGETALNAQAFGAGPAAIEALSAGAIDAAYVGPSPAVNTFVQSKGQSAVIVAGATIGGAALVVRDGIDSPADLAGTTLASPQLGNTQDVALRSWLEDEGYATSTTGGGDVTVTPTDTARALTLLQSGQIDGAWLPEPWVSRLVLEADAHVLVEEADLWPNGEFPTTVLLVGADFNRDHPETVRALLEGHTASVAWLNENTAEAAGVINKKLAADTGKPLSDAVIDRALGGLHFTNDPLAGTFEVSLQKAVAAGIAKDGDLNGLFDLTQLNGILAAAHGAPVSAAGLGTE